MDQQSNQGAEEPLLPPSSGVDDNVVDDVSSPTPARANARANAREFELEKQSSSCRQPSVWSILPCMIMSAFSSLLLLPILPTIKIQWYTRCNLSDENCTPNSDEAQYYSGIFDSIRGAIGFLVIAMIGRISDSVGRKPVVIVTMLFSSLPTLALLLTESQSPALYFTFSIVTGLAGTSMAGSSTAIALYAYVSDVYTPEDRVMYYGLIGGAVSLIMTISPLLATLATTWFSTQQVYCISLGVLLTNVLYVAILVPESLDVSKRNEFSFRTVDPFAPLRLVKRSPVMKWLSVVVFFSQLPETGLVEILLIYCDTLLGFAHDKKKTGAFNGKLLAVVGFAGMFSQTVLLRLFTRMKLKKTTILLISQIANMTHMLLFALLAVAPHAEIVYAAELLTSLAMLSTPASIGIISMCMGPLEQGFAIGTLGAIKGLTAAFAPFVFSTLQSYLSQHFGLKGATMVIGAVLVALSIVFLLFPLRKALKTARLVRYSHSMLFSPALKAIREGRNIDLETERSLLLDQQIDDRFLRQHSTSLQSIDENLEHIEHVRVVSTPGLDQELESTVPYTSDESDH